MSKETINKVIEALKGMSMGLEIDYDNLKYGIISHPLTSNVYVVTKDKSFMMLNSENVEEYVNWRCNELTNHAKDVTSVFVHVNKPYRIPLLSFVAQYLDDKEFSDLLSWIWTSTEFPHQESIFKLVDMFKRARKDLLMDGEELRVLESLPSIVTIYRGLQSADAKRRGLSWTLSLDKAKWFANRWARKGEVLRAEIPKDAIFMYTNSRGEEEVVVNPFRLQNLKTMEVADVEKITNHAKKDAD